MKLDDLQPNAVVRGILPDALVTVVNVQWFGSEALVLTYKSPTGKVANELLYRHDEPRLEVVEHGRPWSFDGDGSLFRLVSEAHRIHLAHLLDPVLAVHTSVVDPLPHQITAVYESMLPRQPLRFLLADDPGAGKTIMAGGERLGHWCQNVAGDPPVSDSTPRSITNDGVGGARNDDLQAGKGTASPEFRSRAGYATAKTAVEMTSCGNPKAVPTGLGNLAQHATFPHSHSRSSSFSERRRRTKTHSRHRSSDQLAAGSAHPRPHSGPARIIVANRQK